MGLALVVAGASQAGAALPLIPDRTGPGNDTMTVGSFIAGAMNLGSDGFVAADGTSASWAASQLVYSSGGQSVTVRILGACTGAGCAALGNVRNVTVTYMPSPTITDPAGNAGRVLLHQDPDDVLNVGEPMAPAGPAKRGLTPIGG